MYILKKSTRKDKKLMVITPYKKIIHFGASGYSDFTIHKDKKRRERYLNRHKTNENWNDPNTAGFWATHILWGISPNISTCIRFIEKKYKLTILNLLN
jgi:hypothetical protein